MRFGSLKTNQLWLVRWWETPLRPPILHRDTVVATRLAKTSSLRCLSAALLFESLRKIRASSELRNSTRSFRLSLELREEFRRYTIFSRQKIASPRLLPEDWGRCTISLRPRQFGLRLTLNPHARSRELARGYEPCVCAARGAFCMSLEDTHTVTVSDNFLQTPSPATCPSVNASSNTE
jgi:hypothetical protein